MRIPTTSRAAILTLCLSLAAAAAFAGDAAAAPPAPPTQPAPAAAAPIPPNLSDSADADEARLQARLYQAQVREQAGLRARMEAAHQREETARQREETARQREDVLRAQMNAARRRLEVAAQQLAALSAQMYGPMMQRVEALSGPPHVLLGVQLDDSDGTGARVREVSPGGAAEQAGVRPGDRIVAV